MPFLTGDQVPDHLRGVEILSAGMEWPASTGPATFTREHLADIVRASSEDPHVQPPRVRLGHTSQLNGDMPRYDPFAGVGDAEPAFGRLVNLRLENDGAVLVADFDEVPEWLADATPSIFPSRSAEVLWDVQTPGGKRYDAVLTAVALLGAHLPAVRDLEDLERLVADGPAALTQEGSAMSRAAELSVSENEVRQRFNFDWATDPESAFEDADGRDVDPYWWWAREIRIGPEEVIADDDAGHLWRVPFSVTDRDEVVFGDPERVRVQYVAASGAPTDEQTGRVVHVAASASARQQAVTCFARRGQAVAASFTDRPTKPQPTAASTRPEREENTMPEITPDQLQRLRELPEDADQEAIDAALAATPDDEERAPEQAAETEREPLPAAASADGSSLTVTVDRQQWEQTQAQARAGADARRAQLTAQREGLVDAAVLDGRIAPAAREGWLAALSGPGERAERDRLARLEAGRVPLDPEGHGETTSASADGIGDDAYAAYVKSHHGIEVS